MIDLDMIRRKYSNSGLTRSQFVSLLRDLYPTEKREVNLVVTVFDSGIVSKIKSMKTIDRIQSRTFIKQLVLDYGLQEEFAAEGIAIWLNAYGIKYDKGDLFNQHSFFQEEQNMDSDGSYWMDEAEEIERFDASNYSMKTYDDSTIIISRNGSAEEPQSQFVVLNEELIRYSGNDSIVIIPSSFEGKAITSIGEKAFRDCNNISEVVIESGVKNIKNGAFSNCKNLKRVRLPNSIVSIGERGEGRQSQQIGVFANSGLESIVIPNSVEIIGPYAFSNTFIQKLFLPDSVKEVGRGAFESCTKLEAVRLSNRTITLEAYTFKNCVLLSQVVFTEGLHYIKTGTFSGDVSLEKLEFPCGLMEIGSAAFSGCKKLKDIYVPFTTIKINSTKHDGYISSYDPSVFNLKMRIHCHPLSFTRKYCETHKNIVVDWEK